MRKKLFIQCRSLVNKNAVRRETIDGVEHIIVTSFTLPDNIVMNGGLYPAEEIAKSFHTLEDTLSPVEHPTDADGNFLSATHPEAIHNFHAGAFNRNVSQVNGRIKLEKFINVQQALKSEKGKRLLDRINEVETSKDPRPIHTSVGVFLEVEEHKEPQVNAAGQEFTWTARDMVMDHDAILLDSVAAAQPDTGVGMAINAKGDKIEVSRVHLPGDEDENGGSDHNLDAQGNELSHEQIRDLLWDALNEDRETHELWPVAVFDGDVIFQNDNDLFTVPYRIVSGKAKIVGIPSPVERNPEEFIPKTNRKGDVMFKEMIVNALKAANIETDGLDDDKLLAAYNELQKTAIKANKDGDDDDAAAVIASAVAAAVKPLTDQVTSLTALVNAKDDGERESLSQAIGDSALYPNLDADTVKGLDIEKLREMAANCPSSVGLGAYQVNVSDDGQPKPFDMPNSQA